MTPYILVLTTTDKREDADRIAGRLVERCLAACVQVSGPVMSTYRWKGKVEKAEEWLCSAKTVTDLYGEVERAIRESHPYEVPEIIALPITEGSADYLGWLSEQLKGYGEERQA